MARFEIKMPKLGESITEGTILSWSVQVGDVVNEDDVLFEVNTAKVSAEIPSPVAGKVVEILFKEGDTVPISRQFAIEPGGSTDYEIIIGFKIILPGIFDSYRLGRSTKFFLNLFSHPRGFIGFGSIEYSYLFHD